MTLGEEVQAWDMGREMPEPSSVLGASSEIPLQAQHMPSRLHMLRAVSHIPAQQDAPTFGQSC